MADDDYSVDATDDTEPARGEELTVDGEVDDGNPLVYDDLAPNLVTVFRSHPDGLAFLKKCGAHVVDTYENMKDSTEEYRERVASDWKIFSGELPAKEAPFENAANAHVPLMLQSMGRLIARVSGEIFGENSNFFSVIPSGPDDDMVAEILTLHGNWQLTEQIRDFYTQMQRGLMSFYVWGDVFAHSYYDERTRLNRHEVLTPDEFFMPYVYVTTQPDLSDVPHKIRKRTYTKTDVEAMDDGAWEYVDEILEHAEDLDDEEDKLRFSVAEITGVKVSEEGSSESPYVMLHYEGWYKLPNQEKARFIMALVHEDTGKVVQLRIQEDYNWQDKQRHDRQLEERDQYFQGMDAREQQMQMVEAQRAAIFGQDPLLIQGQLQQIEQVASQIPPAPPPPDWMADLDDREQKPRPPKMEPVHSFSHGQCIENMAGSYGLSFGRMEADFNRAANTALSQFIDQATVSNCKGFLTTTLVELEKPMEIAPFMLNKVKGVTGKELADNIMPLEVGPANAQLIEVMRIMQEASESAVQAPGVLSGESGKSGETWRGIATRVEQATKQIAESARKFTRFMDELARKNARLNSVFLPEEEIVSVVNHLLGSAQNITVSRKLYERDYRVKFRSDLRFTSRAQKVAEADEIVGMCQIPMNAQNVAFAWGAVKMALEARDRHDLVPLLGPPPDPPATPFGLPPPPPPGMMPPGGAGAPAAPPLQGAPDAAANQGM